MSNETPILNSSRPPCASGDRPQRLLSLDAFRGMTIAAMILVNNPGSWSNLYPPLAHAAWHGWTPTDLVFPFFLFIVGTSLAYSLRKYRDVDRVAPYLYWRIVRRTLVLVLLGLMLASAPRVLTYLLGSSSTLEFSTLRLPGVLQRIALVYCVSAVVVLHVGVRGQAIFVTILLLGYWALLAWLPNPSDYSANLSPENNLVRVVDRTVFGVNHLYTQLTSEKTDPEGLLSTMPAIATAFMGYWCGLLVQHSGANRRTVAILVAAGAASVAIGLAWDFAFPINKKIWTSSYVLLSGGLAMMLFAGCLHSFDVWHWRRLARPWEVFGINAIFAYVGAELLSIVLYTTQIGDQSTQAWLYTKLFTSWLTDPPLASLAYAIATLAFWWLILGGMARRGWTVQV